MHVDGHSIGIVTCDGHCDGRRYVAIMDRVAHQVGQHLSQAGAVAGNQRIALRRDLKFPICVDGAKLIRDFLAQSRNVVLGLCNGDLSADGSV